MPKSITDMMSTLHRMMSAQPKTQIRELRECLRHKVAEDIVTIMREAGLHYEDLAGKMRMSKKELKHMVWEKDLTLSEVSRILRELDAEMYPIIRVRKGKKNVND